MVSIIITSYNKSKTIRRAIRSAISQTYKKCEVIVVDDCSTDSSHYVYREFADKINLISTPKNSGVTYAREEGIQVAKGRYLTFLDADDFLEETAIENCVDSIKKTGADIVQMQINRCFPRRNFTIKFRSKYDVNNALQACLFNERLFPVQCCAKLYCAELINNVTPIDYSGYWGDDRIFNLPILEKNPKIVINHNAKYNYTWGGYTISPINIKTLQEYKEVYELKRDWAKSNGYKFYIKNIQDELVELLKYHIRQIINSNKFSRHDALNYINEELALPFWDEFKLNISAKQLYSSQKYSLNRIIKKEVLKLIG